MAFTSSASRLVTRNSAAIEALAVHYHVHLHAAPTAQPAIEEDSVITSVIIVYAAFHLGAGHTHRRYRKAHSLAPNLCRAVSTARMRACACPAASGSDTACRTLHHDGNRGTGTPHVNRWLA